MQTDAPFELFPAEPPDNHPWSEQVSWDNPIARKAAAPLFKQGVILAARAWRKGRRSPHIHTRSFHFILLMLQGELDFQLGTEMVSPAPGELLYCPPGLPFAYRGKDGVYAQWMYFQIKDTAAWRPLSDEGAYVRPYQSADLMFLLLRRILDAHCGRGYPTYAQARGDANTLGNLLRRLRSEHRTSREWQESETPVSAFRKLNVEIAKSPGEDWTAAKMAEHLHISPSTLLRLCKEAYCVPPKELLIQHRMNRAEQLLATTNDSMAAIAEQVGYKSSYAFSRVFRKYRGVPPGQFRKGYRRMQEKA